MSEIVFDKCLSKCEKKIDEFKVYYGTYLKDGLSSIDLIEVYSLMASAKYRNLAYQTQLVLKIRPVFETNVVTNNVIRVFHKYDQRVLAEKDIEEIKVFALNHGHIVTANFLLDFLIKYDNWFDCLMQVLRDPDVKQNHTATLMEKMKDDLDKEFNGSL